LDDMLLGSDKSNGKPQADKFEKQMDKDLFSAGSEATESGTK